MSRCFFYPVFVIGVLLSVCSCNSTNVYDEFKEIAEKGWDKDSLYTFNICVDDTLQNYNLWVQVRNESNYKYSNLWLFIDIKQPNGESVRDTFEIILAHPSGQWLGKGGRAIKTLRKVYKKHFTFPYKGEYVISLQQGMRDELLTGIHDIGIRMEKGY